MSSDYELRAITGIMGGLSIASSLVIILTYVTYPKLRNDWRQMLVFLSVCDTMQGIFYCTWPFVVKESPYACDGFSMFGIFFTNAAYLWTACVAHQLHRRMKFMLDGNEQFAGQDEWFRVYHTVCWGYPAFIIATCLAFNTYQACAENDCFGCFLVQSPSWRIFGLYATLWVCWIFTLAMYVRTFSSFRSLVRGIEITPRVGEFIRTFRLKLVLVPLLFIVLRLPETVSRVSEILADGSVVPEPMSGILNLLQAFCNPSQGLTNFILFVVATPPVVQYCHRLVLGITCLCPCCPRRPKWDEQTSLLGPGLLEACTQAPGTDRASSFSIDGQSKSFHDLSTTGDIYVYSKDER